MTDSNRPLNTPKNASTGNGSHAEPDTDLMSLSGRVKTYVPFTSFAAETEGAELSIAEEAMNLYGSLKSSILFTSTAAQEEAMEASIVQDVMKSASMDD